MKDIHTELTPVNIFGPVALSADNTPAALDLKGFEAAEVEIGVGIGGITFSGTNKIEFKLTASDDDVTYTAVTADDIVGGPTVGSGGIILSLIAAHAAAATYRYGYIGNKRYLKLLADFSGTHGTATPLYASLWKGHGRLKTPAGS